MAKIKEPVLAKPKYQGTQLERNGELKQGSQSLFSPLQRGKFLKGKKKLF